MQDLVLCIELTRHISCTTFQFSARLEFLDLLVGQEANLSGLKLLHIQIIESGREVIDIPIDILDLVVIDFIQGILLVILITLIILIYPVDDIFRHMHLSCDREIVYHNTGVEVGPICRYREAIHIRLMKIIQNTDNVFCGRKRGFSQVHMVEVT